MSQDVIYKYTLPQGHGNRLTVNWPAGATIRYLAEQNRRPRLWVQLDPEAPTVPRLVICATTGAGIDPDWGDYIGTATSDDGEYVWHYFARPA